MFDSGLKPNLGVYNRLADQLVQVGKVDEAKLFYDVMVKKLEIDDGSYKFMVKTLSDAGKLDEVLKIVDVMLDDDGIEFSEELQEFVKDELRKEGREEELVKLMEEKERQKAEAMVKEAEAAKAAKKTARAAISSLLPSKLFGYKEGGTGTNDNANAVGAASDASMSEAESGKEVNVEEANVIESASADTNSTEEAIKG